MARAIVKLEFELDLPEDYDSYSADDFVYAFEDKDFILPTEDGKKRSHELENWKGEKLFLSTGGLHLLHGKLVKLSVRSDSPGFVYFIRNGDVVKIGRTKNVENRLKQISSAIPPGQECVLEMSQFVDNSVRAEKDLHDFFADSRVGGEWFRLPDGYLSQASSVLSALNCSVTGRK
jgi:hypothetical protein